MRNLVIVFFILITNSCHKRLINEKAVQFLSDSTISDRSGKPKDSMTLYFPKRLFNDTLKYFVSQEERIFFAQIWSFSLFKMEEPVLYNHYLNKEIYRLIIHRSFHKFFVVHIEKNEDSIFIITKRLNRQVSFPFMKWANFSPEAIFRPPGAKKLSQIEIDKIRQQHDSIVQKYNNTNYYIDSLTCKRISKKQWNELLNKLSLIKFWDSYPKVSVGETQIDGSNWVIEGHNESGYQMKEVLSPFTHNKDEKYADLFKFIVNISGLNFNKSELY